MLGEKKRKTTVIRNIGNLIHSDGISSEAESMAAVLSRSNSVFGRRTGSTANPPFSSSKEHDHFNLHGGFILDIPFLFLFSYIKIRVFKREAGS